MLIESQFSFQKILPLGEYAELESLLKSLVLKKPLHGEQSMFNLTTAQLPVCWCGAVVFYSGLQTE